MDHRGLSQEELYLFTIIIIIIIIIIISHILHQNMPSVFAVFISSSSASHLNVISFYTTVNPLDATPLFITASPHYEMKRIMDGL